MKKMINLSKEKLAEKGITYKELAFILNITERQAMNILNKENKALYNYLVISYISNIKIEELFKLTEEEKKNYN
jgi:transcriptional regulator with XRE-family HTH domain